MAKCPKCDHPIRFRECFAPMIICPECGSRLATKRVGNALLGGITGASLILIIRLLSLSHFSLLAWVITLLWVVLLGLAYRFFIRLRLVHDPSKSR